MSKVIVHADKATAAKAVAATIRALITAKAKAGQAAVLGLATGSTPLPLYVELVRLHREEGLSFSNVVSFNLDEYEGLSGDHPQSYRYFMEQNLFRFIDIRRENTHVPAGISADATRTCADYEAAIRTAGGIDLQVLGVGRTGHIGFNEPPSALDSRTRCVHLDEVTRRDNSVFFGELSLVPQGALTMGVGTIMDCRQVELLAFGSGKAEIIRKTLRTSPSADCPASWLQSHAHCTFHLDPAANATL
ncbi:MAG: glucosamine-6-phosphate deaminase [Verrucomicrobia bacterium]|nr:glucosamine-6-phosphate deaminase [Verrucomicrobiota bacterium]